MAGTENTNVAGGMQDDIKAAITSLQSAEAPGAVPASGTPGSEPTAPQPGAAPAAKPGELYGAPPAPKPPAPAKPAAEEPTGLRGEAPAQAAPAKPEVKPGEKPATPPAPKVEAPQSPFHQRIGKPPATWKPETFQHWETIPEAARIEIHRREMEMFRAFQATKEARDFAGEFAKTVAPYQAMLAQEGPVMQAFGNYLKTMSTLRMGTPYEKAVGIAQAIQQFGVPIELLDQALAGRLPHGQPPNGGGQQQGQFRDPRVDELFAHLNQRGQEQQERMNAEIDSELQAFESNPEYPYYEHVRHMMGDLMELAARRNEKMSLQEAYRRSIMTHPELSKLAQQQEMAAAARLAKEAANVSVTGAPATPSALPVTGSVGNVRSDIEAAIAQLSAR